MYFHRLRLIIIKLWNTKQSMEDFLIFVVFEKILFNVKDDEYEEAEPQATLST